MNLHEEAARGEKARQILKDPAIREAIDAIRDHAYKTIRNSNSRELELREDAYRFLKCIDIFEKHFESHISSGKVAESKIEKLKTNVKTLFKG